MAGTTGYWAEYDCAGGASQADAEELIAFGRELQAEVLAWLKKKHPRLLPPTA